MKKKYLLRDTFLFSQKRMKRRGSSGTLLTHTVVSLLAGILGGVIVLVLGAPFPSDGLSSLGVNSPSDGQTAPLTLVEEDEAVINVVDRVSPSVVSIIVMKDVSQRNQFFRSPFDFFFDSPQEDFGSDGGTQKQRVGGGTGFFVTEDGMIVTNKHVVDDANAEYTVLTQDGTEYPAQVLALDPIRDIAVIKVEGSGFPVVEIGDSSSLRSGQTVVAIGYSLGEFANSVSKGIVSGIGRSILAGSGYGDSERLSDIIQTDAAINPGNSGGPLLDIQGKVIGVNVAVAQDAENVGFALPITPVAKIIEQVRETGEITVPYLGVRYVIIEEMIARENNLEFDYGALVLRGQNRTDLAVVPGSPADRAGIEENDIILEIGGERVTEEMPLDVIISQYNVGDEVTLKVWKEGEIEDINVVFEGRN